MKLERIWDALEDALKNGLKRKNEYKIYSTKNWKYEWECKRKNDKCVWGALDKIIQFRAHLKIHLKLHLKMNFKLQYIYIYIYIYIYKDAQKGTPDVAIKGTFLVAFELHLLMQFLMHKSVQNDLTF